MSNYASLKSSIQQVVKTNRNNEITGDLLQQQLLAMVNSLGVWYQYVGIATPDTNPGTPDQNVFYLASTAGTYTNFGGLVLADGEIAILKYNGTWTKDTTGAASLEKVSQLGQEVFGEAEVLKQYSWSGGYVAGTTILNSTLSLFCQPVLFKAGEKLTYRSGDTYGSAVVQVSDNTPIAVGDTISVVQTLIDAMVANTEYEYEFAEDMWVVISVLASDYSLNATKTISGSIQEQINTLDNQVIYDVSANNDGATFASLSALLSSENLSTLIPIAVRCGGMSIRFAQTSDNMYVQFRYMSSSTAVADFTNVANWQGVDDEPTAGSDNLVKSGGVYNIIEDIDNTLNKKAHYEDVRFEDWEDVSHIGEPLSSKYINYDGNLVDPAINGFKVYSFPVTPGDTVKIHCALSAGSSYAYAFYNSNSYSSSTVVGVGPAVTKFVNPTTVIVPDNAAYILIQQFNGSDYGLQKKVINLIKDIIPEIESNIGTLQENTVKCPLNVSRFDVGGTLPAGHRASWITINRRMDEEFDSVLNFCNKYYPNLTNKWFDLYAVGKHARGIDEVSQCDNYTDWDTINSLSTSDALMMAVIVGAVNNIDGDNTTVKWHTGGAHAYGDSATGATPTMRELSNIVRVDGKLIAVGEKNIKGNKCTIDVINNVQGYNTCKADGTGREILQQRYHIVCTNDKCDIYVEYIALEDVIIYGANVVTGFNVDGAQYRFIGSSSKRALYTYDGGNVPNDGDNKINCARIIKNGYAFDAEYDLNYGIGNKEMDNSYNCFVTTAGKCYFANIPVGGQLALSQGDALSWKISLNVNKINL